MQCSEPRQRFGALLIRDLKLGGLGQIRGLRRIIPCCGAPGMTN